ncbi:MAG: hypothetical protein ABIZ49_01855 [Opitutaceae bacterium]
MNDPTPKSPRDLLLARHAHAAPQLDPLRRAAFPIPQSRCRALLHELFFPNRILWRTLAAVWLGLIVFRFTIGRPPHSPASDAIPPAALAAWLAQLKFYDTFAQMDARR